jgi:hypothetical protein
MEENLEWNPDGKHHAGRFSAPDGFHSLPGSGKPFIKKALRKHTTCRKAARNVINRISRNTLVVIGGHVHQFLPASRELWQLFAVRMRIEPL